MPTSIHPDEAGQADTGSEAAVLAARLRLSSTRLARRLRREAGSGLPLTQLSVLSAIESHGPMTLGALAEHERLAPPSITKSVARLEADGLVSRSVDATDRRICRVSVTAAGADLVAESHRRKTAWLTARIETLDPAERLRLAAALDALDALAEAPAGPPVVEARSGASVVEARSASVVEARSGASVVEARSASVVEARSGPGPAHHGGGVRP